MLFKSRETLFKNKDIYENSAQNDDLFIKAMVEVLYFHQEKNEFFYKFLKTNHFNIGDLSCIDDLCKIPPIHAFVFKFREIFSIDKKDSVAKRSSSGTSDQKSFMIFDNETLKVNGEMNANVFNYFGLFSGVLTNYVVFSQEIDDDDILGKANTDKLLTNLAPANVIFNTMPKVGTSNEFDIWGAIRAFRVFEKDKKPLRILGFPAFLFKTLELMQKIKESSLNFDPENSLVLLGGGWKNDDDIRIEKNLFYKKISDQLGIPSSRCRDIYSALEHPIPYVECENHHFHEPSYSRVLIRDVKTLKVLKDGQLGFLNFISPYLLSVPANNIIMPDLAVKYPAERCGCGINRPFFEVIGRSGVNKSRGCAISAMEILRGAESVYN